MIVRRERMDASRKQLTILERCKFRPGAGCGSAPEEFLVIDNSQSVNHIRSFPAASAICLIPGFFSGAGCLHPGLYAEGVSAIGFLECSSCHRHLSTASTQSVCPDCAGILYVRYDLTSLRKTARHPGTDSIASIWRYADVLPDVEPVTLGEGWTSMLPSRRYPSLFVKQESENPTGSMKARGMSVAVSMALHYGVKGLVAGCSGSGGSALAAYSAAAGIGAHLFLPRDVDLADSIATEVYGAHIHLIDGQVSDCSRLIDERKATEGWFDLSALKEPFCLEGEKTMGYELVEQLGWTYPDAVVFPARGGSGLIGIWKAFEEMEQLDWVSGRRPKMITVEPSGDTPVIGSSKGRSLGEDIIRQSGGTVVEVSAQAILASLLDWARHEGLFLSPAGSSATAAYDQLIASGFLKPQEHVVVFNPESGLKHVDAMARAMHPEGSSAKQYPQRTAVGGIITPQ